MSVISCPSCGEKGTIPDHLIGKKLRCHKCSKSFMAGAPASTPPPSAPAVAVDLGKSTGDTIEVDGLDAASWAATAVALAKPPEEPAPAASVPAFHAEHHSADHPEVPTKQYKLLTQKDRWFEGKFELARLEEALNHYARQGWVVRSMATPHVTGFSGGAREEIVVLLER